MSVNRYDSTTGQLVTLAGGQRLWVGTKSAHDAAVSAGTMPNNCLVAITDDEEEYNHYSTDEKKTGEYWIDGKPIYRKVVDFGTLPNASQKDVAHGITNIGSIITCKANAKTSNNDVFIPIPYAYIEATTPAIVSTIQLYADDTNITIKTMDNYWTSFSAYAIIEYTKNAD